MAPNYDGTADDFNPNLATSGYYRETVSFVA